MGDKLGDKRRKHGVIDVLRLSPHFSAFACPHSNRLLQLLHGKTGLHATAARPPELVIGSKGANEPNCTWQRPLSQDQAGRREQ